MKRFDWYQFALYASVIFWAFVCIVFLYTAASSAEPETSYSIPEENPVETRKTAEIEEPEEPEAEENRLIQEALLAKATKIEDCTITWYTADTCGKSKGDPGYGITASGQYVVDGLTCATDPRVIPMYSDVFVQFSDGTIAQYWATDTGVKGNHVDIYIDSYEQAIQNGRQVLTVWWVKEN